VQLWPKLTSDVRPPDRFPRRVLLWLLPGVVGAALLLAVFGYFELRAAKRIVYLTGQGRLAAVRADGARNQELRFEGMEAARFGQPYWSPDGRTVAAVTASGGRGLALLQPSSSTAMRIRVDGARGLSLSGQPWSADSAHVALIEIGDLGSALRIANVAQSDTVTVALVLRPDLPLEWHPTRNELLVTAFTAEQTPTLQIVSPDGGTREFAPQDEQPERYGGVWSPDGGRIAYLANGGDLWVANSDGGAPRRLAGDQVNSVPVWSPGGDAIFFTRELTTTQGYDLLRVPSDGSQPPVRIGPALRPTAYPQSEWRSHIAWSPDGSLMLFEGQASDGDVTLYVSPADGSAPFIVEEYSLDATNGIANLPVARWSPTNRAILVASEARMRLHWLDSGSTSSFPSGLSPSWQP
jgi:Tol biopolymer transport system component